MNNPRGSTWSIWDLHVHTPESIIQNYGAKNNATWEKFLCDIESLPSSIRVLGINDYIFLDGYRRIKFEKENGRLPNIDLLLPVIELRLDKFGGTDSNLSRVNFHVVFSDEIDLDTIQQQFINALSSHYILSSTIEGLRWEGVVTKDSLTELGNKIIKSVPETERDRYMTPLMEGFNSLNINLDSIRNLLARPYFKDKILTAVGKTEWWNIRWNDKSIADKKTIINSVDMVFTASESIEEFQKSRGSLIKANVNNKLLDCSDAHSYASSAEKDRLGNCLTWIKADPTFQGLKHTLIEFEERIFAGATPPQIIAVDTNKTRYIKAITIRKVKHGQKSLSEIWFNSNISINSGLVAIIGNKGSGKSALGDVIGLLGNTKQHAFFSFLNNNKFKKPPENKARFFEAELHWESGEVIPKKLDATVDGIERVKYIPQDYFEKICTELGGIEETAFDKELKNVIYSHVSNTERLSKKNLDELIDFRTSEIYEAILSAKKRLGKINQQIVELEDKLSDENLIKLEKQLEIKQNELKAIKKSKPRSKKKVTKKSSQNDEVLNKEIIRRDKLKDEIQNSRDEIAMLFKQLSLFEKLERKLDNLEVALNEFFETNTEISDEIGIDLRSILKVSVDRNTLAEQKEKVAERKAELDGLLDKDNKSGLYASLVKIENNIKSLQEKLDEPSREYQKYRNELEEWKRKVREIEGTTKQMGTIAQLKEEKRELGEPPKKFAALNGQRVDYSRKIYKLIQRQKNALEGLYSPVQRFIADHPDIGKKIDLKFGASIMNIGFSESLFNYLNLTKAKSFTGFEGKSLLVNTIEHFDFDNENDAINFAEEITKLVHYDKGIQQNKLKVTEQLKQGKNARELYNFIYSLEYLQARYVLKLGEKELRQLSPGERGALLIVFYLLVDLDTIPLIIDQPEHNLDNETVTKLLVPAIKKAKTRRQIIIITHNPILAVVCNSDQIIVASLEIKDGYHLEYITGAIENPLINRKIVDILEGTLLSFDNRQKKYIREYLDALI